MKITARAPANIALIKYWGKKDAALRLPLSGSVSMNLDKVYTITTVEFSPLFKEDQVGIGGEKLGEKESQRVVKHLDRVRKMAGVDHKARVETKNNFPKGTGIASSASGFAALTLAATKSAGLDLTERELSILARLGSGSACRSIPDGFVEWVEGNSHQTSYGRSLYPPGHWGLVDVVAVVTKEEKKVSSTRGHSQADTSPFLAPRIRGMAAKIKRVKEALVAKDFTSLGEAIEAEALNMHAVMMTSVPPILYWLPKTIEIMLAVQRWRQEGLESYFTLDAGATVHVIAQEKDHLVLEKKLSKIEETKRVIASPPGLGARIVKDHLF